MKKYSDEFKKTLVDLVNSGLAAYQVAKDYDVPSVTLYKWVKDPRFGGADKSKIEIKDDISKENRRLKKEIANLREENEILKKVVSIFS